MDLAVSVGVQIMYTIASLFLISVGLAIVFGMMGVINFAHGEFLMLGGFAFVFAEHAGINMWVAMFIVAPLAVALVGAIIERLIIRHLYGRLIETILATWGLSLLLIGITSSLFGYHQMGVSPPFGTVSIGVEHTVGIYILFIIFVAIALGVVLLLLLRYTSFGLVVRTTMQDSGMAAALGINVKRVYAGTFSLGAAVAGLAGAVLAPITGVLPISGLAYIAKAFITVVLGGPIPLAGVALSSTLLGAINQVTTFLSNTVVGEVMLLVCALVLLRFLPTGITGRFMRGGV